MNHVIRKIKIRFLTIRSIRLKLDSIYNDTRLTKYGLKFY